MKVAVFTLCSVGIGIVFGVLVAVGFGHLYGADWGLAAMNGMSAAAARSSMSSGCGASRAASNRHAGPTRKSGCDDLRPAGPGWLRFDEQERRRSGGGRRGSENEVGT